MDFPVSDCTSDLNSKNLGVVFTASHFHAHFVCDFEICVVCNRVTVRKIVENIFDVWNQAAIYFR